MNNNIKRCNECKQTKLLEEFYRNNKLKSGYNGRCKDCVRKYCKATLEDSRKRNKKSYLKHREKNLERLKEHYRSNTDKYQKYRKNRKEHISDYDKEYCSRPEVIVRRRSRIRERYRKDKMFHITQSIRRNITGSFKRAVAGKYCKSKKVEQVLGCSISEFKHYIESKFSEGMSWDNHGVFGWHLDHIIPISSAKTEKDIYLLCHYTNFQPLWAKDNLIKSNKKL